MKQELLKYLFRDGTYTYAVLDGASVPDLPIKLYEMNPPHECLYRGELSDEMIHVAPYLVNLLPENEFTDWMLEGCWGRHWGIFAQSPVSMTGMQKHFRVLLTVYDEDGQPLLFRYYDPRVLPPYLLTCNQEELDIIFGEVKYYFAESNDRGNLFRFQFKDGKLNQTQLSLNFDEK